MVAPRSGRLLGNFPQGLSDYAHVQARLALEGPPGRAEVARPTAVRALPTGAADPAPPS